MGRTVGYSFNRADDDSVCGDILIVDILLITRRGVLHYQSSIVIRELLVDTQTRGIVGWAVTGVASRRCGVGGENAVVGLLSCGDFFGVLVTPADTD